MGDAAGWGLRGEASTLGTTGCWQSARGRSPSHTLRLVAWCRPYRPSWSPFAFFKSDFKDETRKWGTGSARRGKAVCGGAAGPRTRFVTGLHDRALHRSSRRCRLRQKRSEGRGGTDVRLSGSESSHPGHSRGLGRGRGRAWAPERSSERRGRHQQACPQVEQERNSGDASDKGVMTPTRAGRGAPRPLLHLALAPSRGCGARSREGRADGTAGTPSAPRTGVPRRGVLSAVPRTLQLGHSAEGQGLAHARRITPRDWGLGAVI